MSGFLTANVSSMAGFAMKQTFDYVHRGIRLERARALLKELDHLQHNRGSFTHVPLDRPLRLDHTLAPGGVQKVIHFLSRAADLELGTTVNNNKEMITLKLNGREYLETTTVGHLWTAVDKLIGTYGERSKDAAEKEVDPKSLMHAVRVYQQASELLVTGGLTFPRPNVNALLKIKTLETPLEETKELLLQLEIHVGLLQERNPLNLQTMSPELSVKFDHWLLETLKGLYGLN
jgi:hypothetical protein